MKRERVRKGKRGKRWREEMKGNKQQQGDRLKTMKMRTGGNRRDKQRNTRTGKSVAFPQALQTAGLTAGDDSVHPL